MAYALAKSLRGLVEHQIHKHEPTAVFSPKKFPWSIKVEARHALIKEEVLSVLQKTDSIVNFEDVLPGQRALTQKEGWKSFFLTILGKPVPQHLEMCPETAMALNEIPGVINAFFSILQPGVKIPAHRGPYAGVTRYHLGVIIPKGDVAIRVNGATCHWGEGKSLFFDDSFEHEAWNNTTEARVVLFVDIERPLPFLLSLMNKAILKFFEVSETAQAAEAKVMQTQI